MGGSLFSELRLTTRASYYSWFSLYTAFNLLNNFLNVLFVRYISLTVALGSLRAVYTQFSSNLETRRDGIAFFVLGLEMASLNRFSQIQMHSFILIFRSSAVVYRTDRRVKLLLGVNLDPVRL